MRTEPYLAAFTTDVEDYFQAEALREFCPRADWANLEDRTELNTLRVLELLARKQVLGTFFILGWTAERHPELVKRIAKEGHEVASHGYGHELIYRQTPEEFRKDVRRCRKILQDLSGQEVVGYRAPSYTIVEGTRWALDVLTEEGYEYDSSIFPIKRRKYGIPDAPRGPHWVDTPQGRLAEFPLPAVRLGPMNVPATGGAYVRLLPLGFQKWAINQMLQDSIPVVLNVHPWELDPDQPRFPVSRRTQWTHYHNLGQTADRLDNLLDLAEFTSLRVLLAEALRKAS